MKFRAVVTTLLAAMLLFTPGASPSVGQPSQKRDGEELKRVLATLNVTVYLQNNPVALKGMPSGTVELFGRRFLLLTKTTGGKTLVSTDAIAAIQGD